MRLKKGDKVVVIAGKDRGKEGTVTQVLKKDNKIIVDGVNVMTKHLKSNGQTPGSIEKMEAPIDASNVMIYDAKAKKPSRVSYGLDKNNKKIRITKKSNESID